MLTVEELTDREGGELCDLLEWWECFHEYPGVVFTKKHRFLMTYDLAYRDTEQMSPTERAWYLAQIDDAVRLLPEGWAVDADLWHEATTAYPLVDWDGLGGSPVDKLVDKLRHAEYEAQPRHQSWVRVTLSWDPPGRARQWLREALLTRGEVRRHRHNLEDDLGLFLEGGDLFVRTLQPALDACTPLSADALCTYLHQCVSWDRQALQCPADATDLDWQLTSDIWVPGQPLKLGDQYMQMFTIKTWTPALRTFVPEVLSKQPFPLRYHVRWVPKSLTTADALISAMERKWAALYKGVKGVVRSSTGSRDDSEVEGRSTQDLALKAGESLVGLRRDVRQGSRVVGQLKPTVVLWAPDLETLEVRGKAVYEALQQQGLVVRQEKAANSIEWLASLPGHRDYGLRHRLLSTEACTAVMPHCAQWRGAVEEPCLGGPPWLQATSDGAPFGVAMHDDEIGSAMILGPTRCHAPGTAILMADGCPKVIEEIKVGDQVMGPDSLPRQVQEVHTGVAEMVRIVPHCGQAFEVTIDHILVLQRVNTRQYAHNPLYPRLHKQGDVLEISVRDWLMASKTFQHIYKLFRVAVTFPVAPPLPLHPYLLGVLLGDGSFTKGTPEITNTHMKVKEKLRSILTGTRVCVSLGYTNTSGCPTYTIVKRSGIRGNTPAATNPVTTTLKQLGLHGKTAADKFIPHIFKTASREERLWLLAGLLDTDGSLVKIRTRPSRQGHKGLVKSQQTYTLTSKSQRLRDDIAFVARSLGFRVYTTSCVKQGQQRIKRPYYTVTIGGDVSSIPVQIEKKQVKVRLPKSVHHRYRPAPEVRTSLVTGFEVERVGHGTYYGFTCDKDQRYLLGDFVVSHNSGKSGLLGLLASQGFKYPGMRMCLFDLDYSLYCLTLMRGGAHYALGAEGTDAIQLLGPMDTEAEQEWAALQLELILTGEGLPPTPEERRELLRTVRALGDPDVPPRLRTMSVARTLLQCDRLKVGLAPFCAGGEYAFCDGSGEVIAWDSRLVCFEMASLKNKPRALGPVLAWCFHQLERRWFTGSPVRIVVDEARWLLGMQAMFGQFEEWLKTRAKLKVGLWLSTQEIHDLHKVGLWQAALGSMPIRILLPNPDALSAEVQPLYEGLKVPTHLLRRLSLARRYQDYLYCAPAGHRLFQCALSRVQRLLCAASRKEEITLLHTYRAEYSPTELPVRWLEHFGCTEEASLLSIHLQEEEQLCAVQSVLSLPMPWESSSSVSAVS